MRTQIFTDKELEDLDSRLHPVSTHNLVAIVETIKRKYFADAPKPEPKFDLTKPPRLFCGYKDLWDYTAEINDYFGRPLIRPQAYMRIERVIETELCVNIYAREAIILQDKEAMKRRQGVLRKIKKYVIGSKFEDEEIQRLFARLYTPQLAKDMAEYNWEMVNMKYYSKELELHAKIRKTSFDIKGGKLIEDMVY